MCEKSIQKILISDNGIRTARAILTNRLFTIGKKIISKYAIIPTMFTLISIFGNPHISKNWLLGEERQSKNNATHSTTSIGKASKYASSTNFRKVSPAMKTTNT
mgnify:CR=1 FL=1